MPELMAL